MITLSDGFRHDTIISRNFTCPRCNIFCMEMTPVVNSQIIKDLKSKGKPLPRAKVYCRNGCQFREGWEPKRFDWSRMSCDKIREWPSQWREDEKALRG